MNARPIPEETRRSQALASQPDASAWVSANAGSGKTHVLTTRVIRLLLSGAAPSSLLCLTFTKAAAANMSLRVFRTLAAWTAMSDDDLAREIAKTGTPFRADLLATARRLFARTIEAPGGLKIQTIHSFCESILHLFPFEANVPASFKVLDGAQRERLMALAKSSFLVSGAQRPSARGALESLSGTLTNFSFDALVDEALKLIDSDFPETVAASDYPQRLGAALGLKDDAGADEIERRILFDGLTPDARIAIASILEQGSPKDRRFAETLRALESIESADRADAYLDLFLKDGEPRGRSTQKLITKESQARDPGLLARLDAEADRLAGLRDALLAARIAARSRDLGIVLAGVLEEYEGLKRRRGLLDFDDLIARTANLLRDTRADWVRYKLDSGIDHILVDEAQDTSAAQWRILESLISEFTSGQGARPAHRTFFAVGDEKQSIFSFQGAAPILFDEYRRKFHANFTGADKTFHEVPLNFSFRSSPAILEAVDSVFAHVENRRGLSAENLATVHAAWKADLPGHVEIWPPVAPEAAPEPSDWKLPLDAQTHSDPPAILSERIADLLTRLLDPKSGEAVRGEATGSPRAIHGGDIMILLRRRGVLFESIIRALKLRGLPVAGADRMVLRDHLAVMDLMALGRICLLPEDDLSLACLLKSPLFEFDDNDLMSLAPSRKGSLFDALTASRQPAHAQANETLLRWRAMAAQLPPSEFFARILEAENGRARFSARLGPEAGDALDEFIRLAMQTESGEAPSLQRFLQEIETGDLEVKRDMEAAGASIRVMTVHASKGLESKIVLLPDTYSAPGARHDPKLYRLVDANSRPVLAWSAGKTQDCHRLRDERDRMRAAAMEEYRRLLYVALTRAEERLYVMGCHGQTTPAQECWRNMIWRGLESQLEPAPAPWRSDETIWRVRPRAPMVEKHPAPELSITHAPAPDLPEWLFNRVAAASVPAPLQPSRAGSGLQPVGSHDATAANSAAIARGVTVHALLQLLPALPRDQRARAARERLGGSGSDLRDIDTDALIERLTRIIDDPRLSPLFSTSARAEVEVAGRIPTANGDIEIRGRIDRMAEVGSDIWLADFKTGAVSDDPAPYAAQLALYAAAIARMAPDRKIRAFVVAVDTAKVLKLSPEDLSAKLADIVASANAARERSGDAGNHSAP